MKIKLVATLFNHLINQSIKTALLGLVLFLTELFQFSDDSAIVFDAYKNTRVQPISKKSRVEKLLSTIQLHCSCGGETSIVALEIAMYRIQPYRVKYRSSCE